MAFSSGVFKEKGFVPHGKKMNFSPCLNIGKCCLLLEVLPLVVWARKGIPTRAPPPSVRPIRVRGTCARIYYGNGSLILASVLITNYTSDFRLQVF